MAGGAERAVELTNPDVPPRRARRDVRRPRRLRPGRRPPVQRRRPRRARRPRSTPTLLLPGIVPLPRDEGDGLARRGAVGRPLRQLPAQRRPRRARRLGRRGVAVARRRRRRASPRSATTFADARPGALGLVARLATACCALVPRPALGGRASCGLGAGDAGACSGRDRPTASRSRRPRPASPGPGARRPVALTPMRPATTLTLGLLLVAILVAGVIAARCASEPSGPVAATAVASRGDGSVTSPAEGVR